MKLVVTIILALAMTACASRYAETPAQRVFAAKADYLVPLRIATSYESLPRCKADATATTACSRTDVVDIMRRADKAAAASLDTAEGVVRNPAQSPETLELVASAAEGAVKVFRTILTDNGVLK